MMGWRRALDIYVAGRNRSITTDEKRAATAAPPSSRPMTGSDAAVGRESSFGVSVPEDLDYYRNAGTWRESLGVSDASGKVRRD